MITNPILETVTEKNFEENLDYRETLIKCACFPALVLTANPTKDTKKEGKIGIQDRISCFLDGKTPLRILYEQARTIHPEGKSNTATQSEIQQQAGEQDVSDKRTTKKVQNHVQKGELGSEGEHRP